MQKLCGGNPAARKSSIAATGICSGTARRARELFPHGNPSGLPKIRRGMSPSCKEGRGRTTQGSFGADGRGLVTAGGGSRAKASAKSYAQLAAPEGGSWPNGFGLVGEARPHLSHLQHRGSGLGVARGA